MAMSAAPPANTMGTAESGPPFWNRRKNMTVPAPTLIPVRIVYDIPRDVAFCVQVLVSQRNKRYNAMVTVAVASTTKPPRPSEMWSAASFVKT